MAGYYNDDWMMYPMRGNNTEYSRKYSNIGFSTAFIKSYKSFNAGMRIGFVTRKLDETFYEKEKEYENFNAFTYRQKHFLTSIFIQKSERIKFLNVHIGIEIPYISYGAAASITTGYSKSYQDGKLWSEGTGANTILAGNGFGLAIGANLGASLNIRKYAKIGFEINQYFLYTEFVKPIVSSYDNKGKYYYPESDVIYKKSFTKNVNFKQATFSQIAPRVFFSVLF